MKDEDGDYLNYEDDAAGRVKEYRCGGYGSYFGHCGAEDCETCHPGGAASIARDAANDQWLSEVEPTIMATLAAVKKLMAVLGGLLETGRDEEFLVSDEVRDEIQARANELADIVDAVTEEE